MIDVSSWIRNLLEEITNPGIYSSVHGEHNDTNFECVHHSIRKLHLF